MTKRSRRGWALALGLIAGAALAAAVQTMTVQVQSGQIRSSPSFLGSVVTTARYGERVEVTAQQGAWIQVRSAAGAAGWMHQSALTTARIAMQAGGGAAATGASSSELALAGKGFSSDVEAQFKAQNRQIDFRPVDRMEKQKVTPEEMRDFLKEGGVEGGAR